MNRQDIVDALRLEVERAPTAEDAERLVSGIPGRLARQYPDDLPQLMAVYTRSQPAFDAALAHVRGTQDDSPAEHVHEVLADHPDDSLGAQGDPTADNAHRDKAERNADLEAAFGEIPEDERQPPIERVFGEVGAATAEAEVIEPPKADAKPKTAPKAHRKGK